MSECTAEACYRLKMIEGELSGYLGREIPVEDAFRMEVAHSLRDVGGKSDSVGPLELDRLVVQHHFKTPTVDILKAEGICIV